MLDYVVEETELSKGFTLGDYVKLKGLSEKDWLLIYDENEKLLTGVRADGLTASEKDYYIVTVQHHIFPIYVSHSDRGYYIVVYISRTSVDVIPKVCTLTEVQVPEDTEKPSGIVDTNIGEMPVEDYKDIVAIQNGFNNYDDMLAEETTSETEQPAEDAEAEDNPELTPLERAIFEAFENSSNLYVEYICKSLDVMKDEEIDEYGCYSSVVLEQVAYFHKLASIEDLKTQFLLEIISKAGLDETYQAWLAERKEQKAVGDK